LNFLLKGAESIINGCDDNFVARSVYTSGQVSVDEEGKLVGAGDLAAQTTQAMKNLGLALEAAGATYADIVKTTTFVVDYRPDLRTVITDAKKPFWAGEPPTSALIGVAALALPDARGKTTQFLVHAAAWARRC